MSRRFWAPGYCPKPVYLYAPGQYDLQCKVNHLFYGLTNFILGNYESVVAILDPNELAGHIKQKAQAILDKKM